MAVGSLRYRANIKRTITLLEALAASNAAPTDTAEATETEGVPCYSTGDYASQPNAPWASTEVGAFFGGEAPESSRLTIDAAGTGTMTVTAVLWGYLGAGIDKWYPIPVNGGNAIAETGTDVIKYSQEFTHLGCFDRLYLQATLVGDTNVCNAYLTTCRVRS